MPQTEPCSWTERHALSWLTITPTMAPDRWVGSPHSAVLPLGGTRRMLRGDEGFDLWRNRRWRVFPTAGLAPISDGSSCAPVAQLDRATDF